jgi:hypothetical protein
VKTVKTRQGKVATILSTIVDDNFESMYIGYFFDDDNNVIPCSWNIKTGNCYQNNEYDIINHSIQDIIVHGYKCINLPTETQGRVISVPNATNFIAFDRTGKILFFENKPILSADPVLTYWIGNQVSPYSATFNNVDDWANIIFDVKDLVTI